VQGLLGVELDAQKDEVAAPDVQQQHRRQCVDVEEGEHADDCFMAHLRPLHAEPAVVDIDRRGEIGVGEDRRAGHAGGAAGILQQRDVVRGDGGEARRGGRTLQEVLPGHHARPLWHRQHRNGRGSPIGVLAHDQMIDDAALQHLQRIGQEAGEVDRDQHARAGVLQLMRQFSLGIERAQMHDGSAGLDDGEEGQRMQRHVRQIERDRPVLVGPERRQPGRPARGRLAQLAIGEMPPAKLDRRAPAMRGGCRVEHLRDRADGQRHVPLKALRIGLFPGERSFGGRAFGHGSCLCRQGREVAAFGGEAGEERRGGEALVADPLEIDLHALRDMGQADLVGIEHRPAAPDRPAIAIDPDDIDIAGPHGDAIV
jgi:hypothetical protein